MFQELFSKLFQLFHMLVDVAARANTDVSQFTAAIHSRALGRRGCRISSGTVRSSVTVPYHVAGILLMSVY